VKAEDLKQVQRILWAAADEMRANSSLAPAEYRGPVLGLIFLAYAEQRFDEITPELQGKKSKRSVAGG
jgi:type I restriction enzyme M protein